MYYKKIAFFIILVVGLVVGLFFVINNTTTADNLDVEPVTTETKNPMFYANNRPVTTIFVDDGKKGGNKSDLAANKKNIQVWIE